MPAPTGRVDRGEFPVFVPRPGSLLAAYLYPGSAVVAEPGAPLESEIEISYEGDQPGSPSRRSYADLLDKAAGRLHWQRDPASGGWRPYPTARRRMAPVGDLIHVGTFDATSGELHLADPGEHLAAWRQVPVTEAEPVVTDWRRALVRRGIDPTASPAQRERALLRRMAQGRIPIPDHLRPDRR